MAKRIILVTKAPPKHKGSPAVPGDVKYVITKPRSEQREFVEAVAALTAAVQPKR